MEWRYIQLCGWARMIPSFTVILASFDVSFGYLILSHGGNFMRNFLYHVWPC